MEYYTSEIISWTFKWTSVSIKAQLLIDAQDINEPDSKL